MRAKLTLILIISMAFGSLVAAELPSHPLTFKNWKRLQVHDSTTEVIKLSEQIKSLTAAQDDLENSSEEKQQNLLKDFNQKKGEQQKKLENLQYSKQLNFEDYFDVYLSKFSGNKEALSYIAQRLSKKSVAYLLERSISKGDQPGAKIEPKPPVEPGVKN